MPTVVTFRLLGLLGVLALSGCALLNSKPPLRPTLAATTCKPPSVTQHNLAGTAHYQAQRLEPARDEFLIAVKAGPTCAEAHYNLGLALMYLGEKDAARKHFLEAADLAPGHQVIWDSPALRPYGEPQKERKKETAAERAPGAFGNRGGDGGY